MATKEKRSVAPPEGFKPIGFEIWKPESEGSSIRGEYLKSAQVQSSDPKMENETFTGYHIRVFAVDGTELDTPKVFTVSGAMLNPLFDQIEVGQEVFIVYEGEEQKGSRRMKRFELFAK